MVTTLLIVGVVFITIGLTGFITLKAVQYGLRWQVEVKQDMKPTMPNTVTEYIVNKSEQKEINRQQEEAMSIFNEYLNGGDPK